MERPPISLEAEVEALLRKIGWDRSDFMQAEIYARMSPARKVEQMFRIRREHLDMLEVRLRREHPDCTRREIAIMVQERLDLVRERRVVG